MRRIPRIITLSPGGLNGERAALAGSRAGALGLLDLEYESDTVQCRRSIERLGRLLKGRMFGIRIGHDRLDQLRFESAPADLGVVVVTGERVDWGKVLDLIGRDWRRPVAEVTTRGEAIAAVAAGIDSVIVAGHEAGGFVSDETSYILLQSVLARAPATCRVWVRGGIGPATAAGCVTAGASGVVLDGALWLARESPLPGAIRDRLLTWDGTESSVLASRGRRVFRGHALHGPERPGRGAVADSAGSTGDEGLLARVGWGVGEVLPAGQDVAYAAELARRYVSIGGIVQAVEKAVDAGIAAAREFRPLADGSPLAIAHGTRYPIVQGPMTRVSDRAEFARAVAEAGALPFLAVALMRKEEVRALLREAGSRLAGRPWGVGLLGFVPPELRREQTECILEARPPFVLIAGGRPDQAAGFERAGIPTYLHVPSPGLLGQFLRDGARRFVLEGSECGGHVGRGRASSSGSRRAGC